ncbi:hypothetical protein CS8_051170 [Cupriavidus sp. 8B]
MRAWLPILGRQPPSFNLGSWYFEVPLISLQFTGIGTPSMHAGSRAAPQMRALWQAAVARLARASW